MRLPRTLVATGAGPRSAAVRCGAAPQAAQPVLALRLIGWEGVRAVFRPAVPRFGRPPWIGLLCLAARPAFAYGTAATAGTPRHAGDRGGIAGHRAKPPRLAIYLPVGYLLPLTFR